MEFILPKTFDIKFTSPSIVGLFGGTACGLSLFLLPQLVPANLHPLFLLQVKQLGFWN